MSSPKRHHEVPQMILRNFTDANGLLHCYRKEGNRYFSTNPSKVFVQSDLYSRSNRPGGVKDHSKETELATLIEGPAKAVIDKILENARSNRRPNLTPQEKFIWDIFVKAQAFRSKSMLTEPEPVKTISEAFIEMEENHRQIPPEIRSEFLKEDVAEWITHDIKVNLITQPDGALLEALRHKGLKIFVLQNPKKSFVIGDVPVIREIPLDGYLHQPNAGVLYPVAHDVAVAHFGELGSERVEQMASNQFESRWLRKVNRFLLKQSTTIASP